MEQLAGHETGVPEGVPDAGQIREALPRTPNAEQVFANWTPAPGPALGALPSDAPVAEEMRPRTRLFTAGAEAPSPTDLSRLSARARALVRLGNAGAGSPYKSRSKADFAVCLAMFGADYGEAEVWAIMTNPSHGISERTLEKGPHAEGCLALTICKARAIARPRRFAQEDVVRRSRCWHGSGHPRRVCRFRLFCRLPRAVRRPCA